MTPSYFSRRPDRQALAVFASAPAGAVVWLTGLSGAGKSTIAAAAAEELARRGVPVEILDGDVLRRTVCRDLGFSKEDRDENVRRAGVLADRLSRSGRVVLVALVSPYAAARDALRVRIIRFVEVYVNAPLEVCERRDTKGLYRTARGGGISHFTGVSDPYEAPLAPDVVCHTDQEGIQASTHKVLAAVERVLVQARAATHGFRHIGQP